MRKKPPQKPAAIQIEASEALKLLLGKILYDLPRFGGPVGQDVLLERNRLIQERLILEMQQLAEHVYPGFDELFQGLVKKEAEHLAALGKQRIGAA